MKHFCKYCEAEWNVHCCEDVDGDMIWVCDDCVRRLNAEHTRLMDKLLHRWVIESKVGCE